MKTWIILLSFLLMAPAILSANDKPEGKSKAKAEKVTICHKGKTIIIARAALQTHLDHGDTEGVCDEAQTGPYPWEMGDSPSLTYRYYPHLMVYFDVQKSVYYMQLDGKWKQLDQLTPNLKNQLDEYETLNMRTTRPYDFHDEVRDTFTPTVATTISKTTTMSTRAWNKGDGDVRAYYYYPDRAVYYDVARKVFFKHEDGKWTETTDMELGALGRKVDLQMTTTKPYTFHEQVKADYPPGSGISTRPQTVTKTTKTVKTVTKDGETTKIESEETTTKSSPSKDR